MAKLKQRLIRTTQDYHLTLVFPENLNLSQMGLECKSCSKKGVELPTCSQGKEKEARGQASLQAPTPVLRTFSYCLELLAGNPGLHFMERNWGGELLCRTVDTSVWCKRTKSKGDH